jgi:hypothetical protein
MGTDIDAYLEARQWLLWGGKDFALVCSMAGIEPKMVRDKARDLMTRGWRAA